MFRRLALLIVLALAPSAAAGEKKVNILWIVTDDQAAWSIGAYGGRPFLERSGRFLHVTPGKLARAERWFERFGDAAVFLGRLTPLVRSFISYPAGLVRMPLLRFTVLTLAGCLVWCGALAGAGWALGTSWDSLHHNFRFVDYAVIALAGAAVLYLVLRRFGRGRVAAGTGTDLPGRRASEPRKDAKSARIE